MEEKGKSLYSPLQIGGAALLGGPFGAIWLIRENFKRLGNTKKAQVAAITAVIATIVVIGVALVLPPRAPGVVFAGIYCGIILQYARSEFAAPYTAHLASGGIKASQWRWITMGLVSLIGTVAAIVLVIVGLSRIAPNFLSGGDASANVAPPSVFTADVNNNKFIAIEGLNDAELDKAINDFRGMYDAQGYPSYDIKITKETDIKHRLTFPKDIHPLLFTFLVNFLEYPFDVDLKTHHIEAAGFSTINTDFQGVPAEGNGQLAVFYIPSNDDQHDVVYLTTGSGLNMKNQFSLPGNCIWMTSQGAPMGPLAVELLKGMSAKSGN